MSPRQYSCIFRIFLKEKRREIFGDFLSKTLVFVKFLNWLIETLGIIINRRSKGRPRKRENYTIEKIGCVVPIFQKLGVK